MEQVHELPQLPYDMDALEPHISRETMEYHYTKHHAAYINKLNELIKGTQYASQSLEGIITSANGMIFNNAAQAWNHNFYWHCLSPNGGVVQGEIVPAIKKMFRSVGAFELEFIETANRLFGSGWTWLVLDRHGNMVITNTHDADTPLRHGHTPLLTCDVWEHAYYIDHRNARKDYLTAFWKLVNWDFVNQQYIQAKHKVAA